MPTLSETNIILENEVEFRNMDKVKTPATPAEKAKDLVNEKYYQPLTLHLNLNNNSKEMWEYAKRCALIAVDEILKDYELFNAKHKSYKVPSYWQDVKKQIELL